MIFIWTTVMGNATIFSRHTRWITIPRTLLTLVSRSDFRICHIFVSHSSTGTMFHTNDITIWTCCCARRLFNKNGKLLLLIMNYFFKYVTTKIWTTIIIINSCFILVNKLKQYKLHKYFLIVFIVYHQCDNFLVNIINSYFIYPIL